MNLLAELRDRLGPDADLETTSWPDVSVVVRAGERSVDVVPAAGTPTFTMQFWRERAVHAIGGGADLDAAADAARAWLAGAMPAVLRESRTLGTWVDRSDGIEFRWQVSHALRHRVSQLVRVSRVIELAMAEPRLRALYPFTSHDMLGFRRGPYPSRALGVRVSPERDGSFTVRYPERQDVKVPDAEAAVAEVLNRLP